MTVLVIAEHDHATVKPATLNTVTAGIACQSGDVHVLVAGANAAEAAAAAAKIAGVAKVIAANSPSLAENLAEVAAAEEAERGPHAPPHVPMVLFYSVIQVF
jgi:electron transfer flavoprotein alpha subunit